MSVIVTWPLRFVSGFSINVKMSLSQIWQFDAFPPLPSLTAATYICEILFHGSWFEVSNLEPLALWSSGAKPDWGARAEISGWAKRVTLVDLTLSSSLAGTDRWIRKPCSSSSSSSRSSSTSSSSPSSSSSSISSRASRLTLNRSMKQRHFVTS